MRDVPDHAAGIDDDNGRPGRDPPLGGDWSAAGVAVEQAWPGELLLSGKLLGRLEARHDQPQRVAALVVVRAHRIADFFLELGDQCHCPPRICQWR